jgi:hypothetical protein
VGPGEELCQRPIDVPVDFDRAVITLADGTAREAEVRELGSPDRIEVCVEGPVTVMGNVTLASRSSEAYRDGRPADGDMAIVFTRAEDRSLLASVPDIVSRAALFHGEWVKPWVIALLGVLLLTAFPLLLVAALRGSQAPAPEAASMASNSSGGGKVSRTTDGEWASSSSRE